MSGSLRASRLAALLLALSLLPAGARAAIEAPHVPGELIVRFVPHATEAQKAAILADLGGATAPRAKVLPHVLQRLGDGADLEAAIARHRDNPLVAIIEPNFIIEMDAVPDDPDFGDLWGLHNTGQTGGTPGADIDATAAWDMTTGTRDVVVAVIDTGVDYEHPDLAGNVWTNPGEIPGNGLDDDGNGFVDDVHGWDFANGDAAPLDDHGHGTHCAGTIGALGDNGYGVVGVNWTVSIMALKFLTGGGSGTIDAAIGCVDYAVSAGADVISASWGGGARSAALEAALLDAEESDVLFVAAAGNTGTDNDTLPQYPSSYHVESLVAVAASDQHDQLASFSCYGLASVDLAAPGVGIVSTLPGGRFGSASGTSMATPHVAGVAALVRGRFPALDARGVKARLLSTVDAVPALSGRMVSGGRLNAAKAVAEPDSVPPAAVADLAVESAGSSWLELRWTAVGDDGRDGRAGRYDLRVADFPLDEDSFASAPRVDGAPLPAASGTPEAFRAGGLVHGTTYWVALRAVDESGNAGPLSNVASVATLGAPVLALAPDEVVETLPHGGSLTRTLALTNAGEGTLDFVLEGPVLQDAPYVAAHAYEPLAKDAPDTRQGDMVVAGSGGPDAFGYRWEDSDDPLGPAFAWEEVRYRGVPVLAGEDDAVSGPVELTFDFPYYGEDHRRVWISSNGFLALGDAAPAYANQRLPNPGAPAYLVAPYWDDLVLTDGAVFVHDDGTRLVVQWQQADNYQGGGPHVFQAILAADGTILFQYLRMAPPADSATVGIQDGSGTDGLTVAFNAPYVRDGLAVRLRQVPRWATVSPRAGTVWAGETATVDLAFDAAAALGGDYVGELRILSNDPAAPSRTVPLSLDVVGTPAMALDRTAHDFGEVFVGGEARLDMKVVNDGTDVLTVDAVASSDAAYAAEPAAFSVPPGRERTVTVVFAPGAEGPHAGTLTFTGDAPGAPALALAVGGTALPAPALRVQPGSHAAALEAGGSANQLMVVFNDGASPLDYELAVDLDPSRAPDAPAVAELGGPDAFGHRWVDSDEPDGPVFDWTDISEIGTPVFTTPVLGFESVPVGFPFPFFGRQYSNVLVNTSGYLAFTSTTNQQDNRELPSVHAPHNMLAPFWDFLTIDPAAGRNVYYHYDGSRLIVQYHRLLRTSRDDDLTFQVLLYPDGTVVYQYHTMDALVLSSATVGLQDELGEDGLTIAHDENYVREGLAVRIRAVPAWLTVDPAAGTVAPGGGAPAGVRFDATGLVAGRYEADILVTTNDPLAPRRVLPAVLDVSGAPEAQLTPPATDLGRAFVGGSATAELLLANRGTADVTITGVTIDHAAFAAAPPPPLLLGPRRTRYLTVTFAPTQPGPASATVTVHTDDPARPELTATVAGTGVLPPVATLAPASASAELATGQTATRTFTLGNDGGSDLAFRARTRQGAAAVTVHEPLVLAKDEHDPRPGILGTGGPDVFGYRWRDSDDPGGPAFAWEDISGSGFPVLAGMLDDQVSSPVDIGFAFPFYGGSFTQLRVSANGWLSFTSASGAYTNSPLPSTGAPENLVAALFDDLYMFADVGGIYAARDDDRLIVQWHRLARNTQLTLTYEFQVQLFRDGTILMLYNKMAEAVSATVGIQNGARDDGLTVVHNLPYLRDGLAVRIAPAADWLTVTPAGGVVPAGGSVELEVGYDAHHLFAGRYEAALLVDTDDPRQRTHAAAVTLDVAGAPLLSVAPAALDLGEVFVGHGATAALTVSNPGSETLHVDGIVAGSAAVAAAPDGFALAPRTSRAVTVTLTAAAAGAVATGLTLTSDAADSPRAVPVAADAVPPPALAWEPRDTLAAAAPPGGLGHAQVHLCNTGAHPLDWRLGEDRAGADVVAHAALDLAKGEPDPRPGILGTGGPDAYGYTYVDNLDGGGEPFAWEDISATGTAVFGSEADDESRGPFPIGFAFPFYGELHDAFHVSSNGCLSFSDTAAPYAHQPLPSAGAPADLVALFWRDLLIDTARGDQVYYLQDGERLIVQFLAHVYGRSTVLYEGQIVLHRDGRVLFRYPERLIVYEGELFTVGIQNGRRDDGLTVAFNEVYVASELTVLFTPPSRWLQVPAGRGTLAPGACTDVDVVMDAAGLAEGDHAGSLLLRSNDPRHPAVSLDVVLHVGGLPAAAVDLDPAAVVPPDYRPWLTARVELPPGHDPAAVDWSTVRCNGVVPADSASFACDHDFNGNGVPDLRLKFPLAAVHAVLPEGDEVPVAVTGEIVGDTFFRASGTLRVVRPELTSPPPGAVYAPGDPVPVAWTVPPGWTGHVTDLLFSADDGGTWVPVADGLAGTACDWRAPPAATDRARLRVVLRDGDGLLGFDTTDSTFTIGGAGVSAVPAPTVYRLGDAAPNPFNPSTRIGFDLPRAGRTRLAVYDLRGRRVALLLDAHREAGRHHVTWPGRDDRGAQVASGVYFYRLESGDFRAVRRMTLLK